MLLFSKLLKDIPDNGDVVILLVVVPISPYSAYGSLSFKINLVPFVGYF